MPWSTVTGLHREGGLVLLKGASSKKALHVLLISDRRGLDHLYSAGEQNGRLPFRCQEKLSNGKIQRAQKADRPLSSWGSLWETRDTENQGVWEINGLTCWASTLATTSFFMPVVQNGKLSPAASLALSAPLNGAHVSWDLWLRWQVHYSKPPEFAGKPSSLPRTRKPCS